MYKNSFRGQRDKPDMTISVVPHSGGDYKGWFVQLEEAFYNHLPKVLCATNGYTVH